MPDSSPRPFVKHFEDSVDWLFSKRSAAYKEAACLLAVVLLTMTWLSYWMEADVDLFTRVAIGHLVINSGAIPTTDVFTFSPTKAIWHDHELLPALVFYLVSQLGHDAWFFLLRALFVTGIFYVVRRTQKVLQVNAALGMFLLFALIPAVVMPLASPVRAQAFTYLFFVTFLLAFSRNDLQKKSDLLFCLPLILILWVNSHGGFAVGFSTIGIYAAYKLVFDRYSCGPALFVFLAACLALFVNPYGSSFLTFILEAITHTPAYIPTNPPGVITEWLPMKLWSTQGISIVLSLLLVLIGYFHKRESLKLYQLGILLICLYGAVRYHRFAPFFLLAVGCYGAAPVLSALQAGVSFRLQSLLPALTRATVLVILVSMIFSSWRLLNLVTHPDKLKFTYHGYPVETLAWLRNYAPGGKVLTTYNTGSYAIWRLYPKFLVSLDGRFDGLFPISTIDLVHSAFIPGDPRQPEALAALDPDYILLNTEDPAYTEQAETFPKYRELFSKSGWTILTRQPPEAFGTDPLPVDAPTENIWKPLY